MSKIDEYVDLNGTKYVLAVLDENERRLVDEIKSFSEKERNWAAFSNFYVSKINSFYKPRGLSREEITQTPAWKIAQDIAGRLHIAQGQTRPSDYRDELEFFIESKFRTRREFCEATGLSEDMLSHVLAKRKDFGIHTLSDALGRIGYGIQITQLPDVSPPTSPTII